MTTYKPDDKKCIPSRDDHFWVYDDGVMDPPKFHLEGKTFSIGDVTCKYCQAKGLFAVRYNPGFKMQAYLECT